MNVLYCSETKDLEKCELENEKWGGGGGIRYIAIVFNFVCIFQLFQ